MRLCRSTFLLLTCVTSLGSQPPSLATVGTGFIAPVRAALAESLEVAQASPPIAGEQLPILPGSQGPAVKVLQTQLKQLGYYHGEINGKYGKSTQTAVSQFQKAVAVTEDGIVGATTHNRLQAAQEIRNHLQAVQAKNTTKNTTAPFISTLAQSSNVSAQEQSGWLWWLLVLVGVLGAVGGMFYLLSRFGNPTKKQEPKALSAKLSTNAKQSKKSTAPIIGEIEDNRVKTDLQPINNGYNNSALTTSEDDSKRETAHSPTDVLAVEPTSRLAQITKISIVEELINELQSPNRAKRQKAIWELGQKGDSRAVQPLVDLLIDSDSQQRSLILATLTEIGTQTLKPLNRALAISLQDENPEVRKNALRDLTRIYDQMAQISQMLSHAVEDPEAEVQETARWALKQMNRIRAITTSHESLPAWQNSVEPPETLPGEPPK